MHKNVLQALKEEELKRAKSKGKTIIFLFLHK